MCDFLCASGTGDRSREHERRSPVVAVGPGRHGREERPGGAPAQVRLARLPGILRLDPRREDEQADHPVALARERHVLQHVQLDADHGALRNRGRGLGPREFAPLQQGRGPGQQPPREAARLARDARADDGHVHHGQRAVVFAGVPPVVVLRPLVGGAGFDRHGDDEDAEPGVDDHGELGPAHGGAGRRAFRAAARVQIAHRDDGRHPRAGPGGVRRPKKDAVEQERAGLDFGALAQGGARAGRGARAPARAEHAAHPRRPLLARARDPHVLRAPAAARVRAGLGAGLPERAAALLLLVDEDQDDAHARRHPRDLARRALRVLRVPLPAVHGLRVRHEAVAGAARGASGVGQGRGPVRDLVHRADGFDDRVLLRDPHRGFGARRPLRRRRERPAHGEDAPGALEGSGRGQRDVRGQQQARRRRGAQGVRVGVADPPQDGQARGEAQEAVVVPRAPGVPPPPRGAPRRGRREAQGRRRPPRDQGRRRPVRRRPRARARAPPELLRGGRRRRGRRRGGGGPPRGDAGARHGRGRGRRRAGRRGRRRGVGRRVPRERGRGARRAGLHRRPGRRGRRRGERPLRRLRRRAPARRDDRRGEAARGGAEEARGRQGQGRVADEARRLTSTRPFPPPLRSVFF
mmetsp:Transcript_29635/g.100744  ORF Transcript_29635/g.100744 Transcript_29635/m.100744 type:complete len:636 (-) Transcript_29635:19-1926(-)